jgi:hypothetical protein
MKELPDLDRMLAVLKDMPCTNRETAAEKAAAHEWMDKERACRPTKARARHLQAVEKLLENLRQERKQTAAARRKR